ncbi:gamma-glutamyltransferase family protein [Candidatus Ishikawella capsulata]|nr:gamma-glutamyltransferase family protein [Candidatus Ishikawaella capsulata]
MIYSNIAPSSMVVTPHHLATESALAILREGGNAIEAMISAAATISVVYPHMSGLGGDGFWLILLPTDCKPIAIDASGASGSLACINYYHGNSHIPYRGNKSAITVAGTVSGWIEALQISKEIVHKKSIPLSRLLRDAIQYATDGIPVTVSQVSAIKSKLHELVSLPGFAATFIPDGNIPCPGDRFIQKDLANTLKQLAEEGLDSFYRGNFSQKLIKNIKKIGIPLTIQDLQTHYARCSDPLHLKHSQGDIWNMAPPTQGIVSLAILSIIDNLDMVHANEIQTIHRIVEATKEAFAVRDKYIIDNQYMTENLQKLLLSNYMKNIAKKISDQFATSVNTMCKSGDTVWMGIIDKTGMAISFIQSIYHEFGSGVVIPETGIIWHNRGASFNLRHNNLLTLAPRKKPFHTLNPALACLKDGRVLVYGSMGGDGQPQTQAAIFNRYVIQKMSLQEAISAPRWLIGRHWGKSSNTLKLEGRFTTGTIDILRKLGHSIEILPNFSELVGHAGAIVRHVNGMIEGAYDPRSNGSAAGF